MLAAPEEIHQLEDDHLQILLTPAQGLHRGLHPGNVPMVVRAPNVDYPVESPFILIPVVGDVRRQVGRLAIAADQHPVLVIPVGRGAKPQGPILFVDMAPLLQLPDDPFHLPRLVQIPLPEPDIKGDAESLQIPPLPLHHPVQSLPPEKLKPLLRRHRSQFRMFIEEFFGHFQHILSRIAVRGDLGLLPQELAEPGFQRAGELIRLTAGIIDVELLAHIFPHRRQKARQAVAHRRGPGINHIHRARWVSADKLQLDLLWTVDPLASVAGSQGHDLGQEPAPPVLTQMKVDESRASDLGPLDRGLRQIQLVHQQLSHLPGGQASLTAQD